MCCREKKREEEENGAKILIIGENRKDILCSSLVTFFFNLKLSYNKIFFKVD